MKVAALVLSVVLALSGVAAMSMAASTAARAEDALEGAHDLYDARVAVAEAQRGVGHSDIASAVDSAARANATAERVASLIEQMAGMLESARPVAAAIATSSERGVNRAGLLGQRTHLAARLLAAIANYQDSAARLAGTNNRALRRILEALRETNREFPG